MLTTCTTTRAYLQYETVEFHGLIPSCVALVHGQADYGSTVGHSWGCASGQRS